MYARRRRAEVRRWSIQKRRFYADEQRERIARLVEQFEDVERTPLSRRYFTNSFEDVKRRLAIEAEMLAVEHEANELIRDVFRDVVAFAMRFGMLMTTLLSVFTNLWFASLFAYYLIESYMPHLTDLLVEGVLRIRNDVMQEAIQRVYEARVFWGAYMLPDVIYQYHSIESHIRNIENHLRAEMCYDIFDAPVDSSIIYHDYCIHRSFLVRWFGEVGYPIYYASFTMKDYHAPSTTDPTTPDYNGEVVLVIKLWGEYVTIVIRVNDNAQSLDDKATIYRSDDMSKTFDVPLWYAMLKPYKVDQWRARAMGHRELVDTTIHCSLYRTARTARMRRPWHRYHWKVSRFEGWNVETEPR